MKKKLFYLIAIFVNPLFHLNVFCQGGTGTFHDLFITGGASNESDYAGYLLNSVAWGNAFGISARNGKPILFLLHNSSSTLRAFYIMRAGNGTALHFPNEKVTNKFMAAQGSSFGFTTNGKSLGIGVVSDFFIDNQGFIGIGTEEPIDRLTMSNGNFRMENRLKDNTNGIFQIRTGYNNDRYWLGTQTQQILTIGAHGQGLVNFFPEKYAVFYKSTNDADILNINTANINKYALFVEGGVLSEDYGLAPVSSWADYVFEKDYKLREIKDIEEFIETNGHLPDMPSAETISKDGYSLHEMNVKLLQKIEELTLYVIRQEKEISKLRNILDTK